MDACYQAAQLFFIRHDQTVSCKPFGARVFMGDNSPTEKS